MVNHERASHRPAQREAETVPLRHPPARRVRRSSWRLGGKSWSVRTKAKLLAVYYPGIKILIVRKTYKELINNHIEFLRAELNGIAKYNKTDKVFTFGNGSTIWFGYCATDGDLGQYQGAEYDVIFIDEATQLQEEWIKKINLAVRSTKAFPKRTYYTMNPGGVSHGYFKRLFVDRKFEGAEKPEDYSFVKALVTDNKALMAMQPEYMQELENLPPKLRKAWLEGDWNIFEGQFFEDFRIDPDINKAIELGVDPEELRAQHRWCHVIEPFDLNSGERRGWNIMRSYDFGYGKPFSLGYWAIDYDGVLYRILDYYGCTSTPNEGVKWSPDEQFKKISEFERQHPWLKGRKIVDSVADPAIWDASRGESIAETASRYGIYFTPGDNQRIPGWMQMHYRFQFDDNGYARMYVFNNCTSFIRTVPLMMYSETHPEDLDTSLEDHCLAGDTQVLTDKGYKSIESLVGTAGYVMSHDGEYHSYSDVRKTRENADVVSIEMDDGTTIVCTDDHRFMLPNGEWIRARELMAGMEVKQYGSTDHKQHSAEI